jgi:hypothetical protein
MAKTLFLLGIPQLDILRMDHLADFKAISSVPRVLSEVDVEAVGILEEVLDRIGEAEMDWKIDRNRNIRYQAVNHGCW